MNAGRELDALVAENVMGLRVLRYGSFAILIDENGDTIGPIERYGTELPAAWRVIEAMERRGFWCQMRTPFQSGADGDGFWAGFTPHGTTGWNGKPDHWTSAEMLPLAICLAALKACGVEVEEPAP